MNVRTYGQSPYQTAVLHGGPGAPGYMAPVARRLSRVRGILEPLQSADSLDGQIEELKHQLNRFAEPPATLIGSSWGAVLALFIAAYHPEMTRKIVLIGTAVFDAAASSQIEKTRLARLSDENRRRHEDIQSRLKTAGGKHRDRLMSEWGKLLDPSDMYDPVTTDLEVIETQYDIFTKVWPQFAALRDKPGHLKDIFSRITAPAIIIHGEYDPHPIDGIRPFLESCLKNVVFHILPECGHYPWIERKAQTRFYEILEDAL